MNKDLNSRVDEIAKLFYEEYLSLRQIATKLNVSAVAIQKVLKKNGYDTSKENLKFKTNCKTCGNELIRIRSRIKKVQMGSFCDLTCYHIYLEEISIGKISRYGQMQSRLFLYDILGELPEGSIVHHIDGNDDNTDISNLMLLASHKDHLMIHRGFGSPKILFDGSKYFEVIS